MAVVCEFSVLLLEYNLLELQAAIDNYSNILFSHFLCRIYSFNAYFIIFNMHFYNMSGSRIHAEGEKTCGRKRCGMESYGRVRCRE